MALAAGLGTRMRPITEVRPKALVEIAGLSLIERALNKLSGAGVERAVVNLHHLGDMIEEQLAGRSAPEIVYSREDVLLETGGGIANALALLGTEPFYAVNTDILWIDGQTAALARLASAWDDARMDGLLLLHPTSGALGYDGRGDFMTDTEGRLARRPKDGTAPYVFAAVQILHPRLFNGAKVEPFSLNVLYDKAIAAGRLYGLVHDGHWAHVGTPEALAGAEALLAAQIDGGA
jgi:MurNAc alpha-1-phosphate uridylyltransferase